MAYVWEGVEYATVEAYKLARQKSLDAIAKAEADIKAAFGSDIDKVLRETELDAVVFSGGKECTGFSCSASKGVEVSLYVWSGSKNEYQDQWKRTVLVIPRNIEIKRELYTYAGTTDGSAGIKTQYVTNGSTGCKKYEKEYPGVWLENRGRIRDNPYYVEKTVLPDGTELDGNFEKRYDSGKETYTQVSPVVYPDGAKVDTPTIDFNPLVGGFLNMGFSGGNQDTGTNPNTPEGMQKNGFIIAAGVGLFAAGLLMFMKG